MKRILFIHHSTGGLLIRFGPIRALLAKSAPTIEFWDHGYNLYPWLRWLGTAPWFSFHTGLSDGSGKMMGRDFDITISNNSPKEYAEIFSRNPKDSTLKEILAFDVVLFKNCYPTSKIETVEKLERYNEHYSRIFRSLSKYPNKFVIFTQPPLRRERTNVVESTNARKLADFMVNLAKGKRNIAVYNFFDALADNEGSNTNMLKRRYCNPVPWDSHPNITANREVAGQFISWLTKLLQSNSIR